MCRTRTYLLILALLISGYAQATVGPPSWQSDWMVLRSQADAASFKELEHGLNELPLKGKVLVRPMSGSNSGFSFEGVGSAQMDDDDPAPYCGVVFVYNSTHVRLGAPTAFNKGDTSGHIFCAGPAGWSDANGHAQLEHEAEVKVLLWLQETFPEPDLEIDWTFVDCFDPNAVFFEFTGEPFAWVQIQVRVLDQVGLTWVTEGVGSDNSVNGVIRHQGGVIYSHSSSSIRLWIREISANYTGENSVAMMADGWPFLAQQPRAHIKASVGEVRVFGWKTLGEPLFTAAVDVDLDSTGGQQAEILLNTKIWDPYSSSISLQVTPLDGPNEGYTFYGTGVMPKAQYMGRPFGGVHFGYTQSLLRLFYPVAPEGCLMRIGSAYGGGMYQQCSRRARVEVRVWGESKFRPEAAMMMTHCTLTRYQTSPDTRSHRLCMLKCSIQPNCVAVKVERASGKCHMLNSGDVIRELETYDVSQTIIMYPGECTSSP